MTTLSLLRLDVDYAGRGYRACSVADLVAAGVPGAIVLPAVQAACHRLADGRAEALRGTLTTAGSGQAMEYQEAQAQARAALADPADATPGRFPMLAATVGIDIDPDTGAPATDVLGVARSIQAAYDLWLAAGSAIRRARLAGKAAVTAAATPEAAFAALDAIDWPAL